MNATKFNNLRLDAILKMFVNCHDRGIDRILKEHLFAPGCPPDYDKAISFLTAEGCLDEHPDGFSLTYKGRMVYDNGGFVGKYRRKKIPVYTSVIAAILTAIGIIVSIVALCV